MSRVLDVSERTRRSMQSGYRRPPGPSPLGRTVSTVTTSAIFAAWLEVADGPRGTPHCVDGCAVRLGVRRPGALLATGRGRGICGGEAGRPLAGTGGRVQPEPATASARARTVCSQNRRKPSESRPRQKMVTPSSSACRQSWALGVSTGPPITATPCRLAAARTGGCTTGSGTDARALGLRRRSRRAPCPFRAGRGDHPAPEGMAVAAGDPAERLTREAAFLLVFGSRPAIKDALLDRLS
jgi:hypothetical protein